MPDNQQNVFSTVSPFQVLLLAVMVLGIGCGRTPTNADYIPSVEKSRDALKTVLEAWKAGQPTGPVRGTSPVIHVTDSSRRDDQVLESYEILGSVPGNAARCMAVRLKLSGSSEEKRERYVVVGIDPVWVFRHEDYDLLLHWEHPMSPDSAKDAASATPARNDSNTNSDTGQNPGDSVKP